MLTINKGFNFELILQNLLFPFLFCLKIENEYGPESKALGAAGHAYINWAAKMADELDTGVPWVMCKEDDAPDPMVSYLVPFFFFLSLNLSHSFLDTVEYRCKILFIARVSSCCYALELSNISLYS